MLVTFQDAILHVIDYLGGNPSDTVQRDARRAVLECYRDLANAHKWAYLYSHGRIATSAPYAEGTVSYDHAGGAYERQVTLAGGSWPEWAAGSALRIGEVAYRVAERKSATIVTLDEILNPGEDVSARTYRLARDTYLLPADFVAQDEGVYAEHFGSLAYTHPRNWLWDRTNQHAESKPCHFTIVGHPLHPGRLALLLHPSPDARHAIDFVYHRRPRALAIVEESAGRCSIESSSCVLTGDGTSFSPGVVGSVVRISRVSNRPPTGLIGNNPAAFEAVVTAYVSPAEVRVSRRPDNALSGMPYVLSDPVDIEVGSMLNAFHRGCERAIAINRTLKDKPSANAQYQLALSEAKSADSRSFTGRRAGSPQRYRRPMSDHPQGPDDV